MPNKLLIIFAKNPIKGKVKTRLAKSVGDDKALEIYRFLLNNIQLEIRKLAIDVEVHYTHFIDHDDNWQHDRLEKKMQIEGDLGAKMGHAFQQGFKNGYRHIIGIGTDIYNLMASDIQKGFNQLETKNFCFGPAKDGGYYLIGMTRYQHQIFQNKSWSTSSVLKETLQDLTEENVALLNEKMDIDTIKDVKQIDELEQFIK